jgi:hypothetical protein
MRKREGRASSGIFGAGLSYGSQRTHFKYSGSECS